MTKVANGLDLSFLNEEEASKILAVLERDERLKRAERDRVSKLQSAKRDNKWLHGVTGEWFEEIQRKKFRNDPDVSSMLKQPLAYKLRKAARNDSTDLKMSRSKSLQPQKNAAAASSPSILRFRSPFSSLFRKMEKPSTKPQAQQKRHGIFSLNGHSASETEGKTKIGMPDLPQIKHTGNLFGTKLGRMRERNISPTDMEIKNEAFQVLDDLNNKLAREQSHSFATYTAPMSYNSRGQYQSQYLKESGHSDIFELQKDYSQTSSMFLPDGRRRRLLSNEEYRSCSTYRPGKFNDMYSNRHRTVAHHDPMRKETFGRSPSLCSISQSRSRSSPASFTTFSTSSLHLPSLQQSNSGFLQRNGHQESKRKHISSIIWNSPHCNEHAQNHGILPKTKSLMELNNCVNQDIYPLPLQQNRMYEIYQFKNPHRGPTSKAFQFGRNQVTSPIFWDNSEHNPFYQSENNLFEFNGRGFSQKGLMEMETESTWKAENKENHSHFHMSNIDKVLPPYTRSYSNTNNILINVNEQQLAPEMSKSHHSEHSFASDLMPVAANMTEEMKADLDFQSLVFARNKEEISTPEICNNPVDLQNRNSLNSNSVNLHSFVPSISTTSASTESRNQIKLSGQNEDSFSNMLATDASVSQLQLPFTKKNTELDVQTHLLEKVNMLLTCEMHAPAISNKTGDQQNSYHGATVSVSNAGVSFDSVKQTKPSAQCFHSDIVTLGTDASKNDPRFPFTQMNTDQEVPMCTEQHSNIDPSSKTRYCTANVSREDIIPQAAYSQVVSRSASDFQSSQSNISASALLADTPDVTNVLALDILDSRNQSKTELLHKNIKTPMPNYCETAVYRNENEFPSASENNRYKSFLLINQSKNSPSLSSLNQWKGFQQNSAEVNDMKLENMKHESTEHPTGPNSQSWEQSLLRRYTQMNVRNTAARTNSSSNALANHKDALPKLSKVSSKQSQSLFPDSSPSNNFTHLDTENIPLNFKNTEAPDMGRELSLRCHTEENSTFELSQKQIGVANEDHSGEPIVNYSQNTDEINHTFSFSDVQGQSVPLSRQVVSQTFSLSKKDAFSDPNNNRQYTKLTISHKKTSRLVFPAVKSTREGNLNILVPDVLAKTSSTFEDPISNDIIPPTCMLSQDLTPTSENEDGENRTQNSPDLNRYKHMESQRLNKRTFFSEDVASSDATSLSNESAYVEQKRIHSVPSEKPFAILADVTECKLNNSCSPNIKNEHLSSTDNMNTNEKFQMNTTDSNTSGSCSQNDAASVKPFALYYSVRRSAGDINIFPEKKNTAISSSSSNLPFPSRRILDQLPTHIVNRIAAPFSHHENISTVSVTEHSPLTNKPLEVPTDTHENVTQEKDFPKEVHKSEFPTWNPSTIDSVSVKADESVKTHSCLSDGLDKESNLQKNETSSAILVSSDPENIAYLKLHSASSSLTSKHSTALSDVLLNRRNANLQFPNSIGNKKYEFHIKLAKITFPDSLNPRRPATSDKALPNSATQQHSNVANKPNNKSASSEEDNSVSPNIDQPQLILRPTQFVIPDTADSDVLVQAQSSDTKMEKSSNDTSRVTHVENIRAYFSIFPESQEKTDDLHTRIGLPFPSSMPGKTPCPEQGVLGTTDITDRLQTRDLATWQQFENERRNNCKTNVSEVYSPEDTDENCHKGKTQADIILKATYSQIIPVEYEQKGNSETKEGADSTFNEISPDNDGSGLNVRETDHSRSTIHNDITSDKTVLSNTNNSSCKAVSKDLTTPAQQRFQPHMRHVSSTKLSSGLHIYQQEPKPEEQTIDEKSVKQFGDAHNICFEDEVFVTPQLQLFAKAPNYNNCISDYRNDNASSISERINDSVHKTEWEYTYPAVNQNYSNQNLRQPQPAVNDALLNVGNISCIDISKPKYTSLLPIPLRSVHKSGNHSQVLKHSSGIATTSMQRTNQKNIFNDSNKPPSPTTHYSERPRMHRKSRKSKTSGDNHSIAEEIFGYPSSSSTNLQNDLTATRNKNTQMFAVATDVLSGHRSSGAYHDSPLLISSIDTNSNTITKNSLQPSMCLQQEDISLGECGSKNIHQEAYQSKRLKNLNLLDGAEVIDVKKCSRRFSSITSVDKAYSRQPSTSMFSPDGKKHRNFSSFSEVSSNEVNDNWTFNYNHNRSYSTRKIKSIDFGIFGKEQQAAFLENIRRSLTEGRLWRPCFLKNPGFLRSEANINSNRFGFLGASSAGSRMSIEGLSSGEPLNIYQEEEVIYSESDNETTTDDEYYLDDNDKESEL